MADVTIIPDSWVERILDGFFTIGGTVMAVLMKRSHDKSDQHERSFNMLKNEHEVYKIVVGNLSEDVKEIKENLNDYMDETRRDIKELLKRRH